MVKTYAEKQKRRCYQVNEQLQFSVNMSPDNKAQRGIRADKHSRGFTLFCAFRFFVKTTSLFSIMSSTKDIKPSRLVSTKQGLLTNPKQTFTVSIFLHNTTISANAYCLNANHRKWYLVHTQLQGAPVTTRGVPQQPTISFQKKKYTFLVKMKNQSNFKVIQYPNLKRRHKLHVSDTFVDTFWRRSKICHSIFGSLPPLSPIAPLFSLFLSILMRVFNQYHRHKSFYFSLLMCSVVQK